MQNPRFPQKLHYFEPIGANVTPLLPSWNGHDRTNLLYKRRDPDLFGLLTPSESDFSRDSSLGRVLR